MGTHPIYSPTRAQGPAPRPKRAIAGVGRVLLWSGGSLWIGHAAGGVNFHSHHAIQISLALTGRVKFRSEGSAWRDYTAAIVRSHHRHQFDGCGESVAQLFVEPGTVQGRALLERHHGAQVQGLSGEAVGAVIAAQEWGFADSAHLSRTCRRMFGIAPTMLVRQAGP